MDRALRDTVEKKKSQAVEKYVQYDYTRDIQKKKPHILILH